MLLRFLKEERIREKCLNELSTANFSHLASKHLATVATLHNSPLWGSVQLAPASLFSLYSQLLHPSLAPTYSRNITTAVLFFLLCVKGQNKQKDAAPLPKPLSVQFFTSSWTDFQPFPGALEHQSENCISQGCWNKTKFAAGSQITPSPPA